MSASASGGSTGSRSGKPVRWAKPLMASTMVPKPGKLGVGAGLAEAGDADDDEVGVAREQVVGREAHLLERAGAEVLDEDIGGVDQLAQSVHAPLGSRRLSTTERLLRP